MYHKLEINLCCFRLLRFEGSYCGMVQPTLTDKLVKTSPGKTSRAHTGKVAQWTHRQGSTVVTVPPLGPTGLHLNPGSAMFLLRDMGQVAQALYASVSSSIK